MEFKKLKRFTFAFGCCISSSRALEDVKTHEATESAEDWPEEVLEYKRPTIKAIFDPKQSEPAIACNTSLDGKSRRICQYPIYSAMFSTLLHFLIYKQAFMPRLIYALERMWRYSTIESIKGKIPEGQFSEIMPLVTAIFADNPRNITTYEADKIKDAFKLSTQRGPKNENMGGLFMHGISNGLSDLLECGNAMGLLAIIIIVFFAPTVIGAICGYVEDSLNDMAKYYFQSKGILEVEEKGVESVAGAEQPPSEEYLEFMKVLEHLLVQQFRAPLSVIRVLTFPFRVIYMAYSIVSNILSIMQPVLLIFYRGFLFVWLVVFLILSDLFNEFIRMLFGDLFTVPPPYYDTVSHIVGNEAYKKLMRQSAAFYIEASSSQLVNAFQFLGKQVVAKEKNANLQSTEFYRILCYLAYIYPLLGWRSSVHEIEISPLFQIVIAMISLCALYSNYNKISEETKDITEAITLAQERQRNDITEVLGMSYMAIPDYECKRHAAFKEENDRKKLQLAIAKQKMDNYLTFFKFAFTGLSMITILLNQKVVSDACGFVYNWNKFFNQLSGESPDHFLKSFVLTENDRTYIGGGKANFEKQADGLIETIRLELAKNEKLQEINEWARGDREAWEDLITADDQSILKVISKIPEKGLMASWKGDETEVLQKAIETAFHGKKAAHLNALKEKIANGWRCNTLNQSIKDTDSKIGAVMYMLVLCGGMFYIYSSLTNALAKKLELEQAAERLRLEIAGHHHLVSHPNLEVPTGKKLKSHEGRIWAIMPEGFVYKPLELRRTTAEILSTEEVSEALIEAANFTRKAGGVAIKIESIEPETELIEPELTKS